MSFLSYFKGPIFQKVKDLYPEFDVMNNTLKLIYLMSEMLVQDT